MLCPRCGVLDPAIPTPESTPRDTERVLGRCRQCGHDVIARGTARRVEQSQAASVREGERRELVVADVIAAWMEGADGSRYVHRQVEASGDIDRLMLRDGEPSFYFEIKERSCSLNGYRNTLFPYAKIEKAQALHQDTRLPVEFYLHFTDCIAVHTFDSQRQYERGEHPFAPSYRPWQRSQDRQKPVVLSIDQLRPLALPPELRARLAY